MAYTNLGKKTVLAYWYVTNDRREELTKNLTVYVKNGKFYINGMCGNKWEVRKIGDDVFRCGLSRDEIETRKKMPHKEKILQLLNDRLWHPKPIVKQLVDGLDEKSQTKLIHSILEEVSEKTLKKIFPLDDHYYE